MAWKVIGHMNASGDATRFKDGPRAVYFGPHPVKVWVREPKARRKMPKAKNALAHRERFDKADQERKAVEYALWVAKRDNIELPRDKDGRIVYGKCCWIAAQLANGKPQLRVASVSFTGKEFGQIIQIPNWDWSPREATEETIPADTAIADMRDSGLALLFKALLEPARELEAA